MAQKKKKRRKNVDDINNHRAHQCLDESPQLLLYTLRYNIVSNESAAAVGVILYNIVETGRDYFPLLNSHSIIYHIFF